jgi:CheY-like chemotaxis protein/HPt (histidine-containing phosphotransfer) domain-containing protein
MAQTPPADAQFAPRYVASLAHAVRSRLNAVLGGLELVSQTALGEEQRRFVDTAMDEGRAVLQLVSDALELGLIDAGELNVERHPLDPVAIAEGALATVAAHLHQRGIACASVVDPETPVAVIGDGARLHQVLHHLLDNARRATESGHVTLRVWPLRRRRDAVEIGFEVSDSGRGVPEALRDRLFRPMVREGRGERQRYASLGLGLTLCRRLVEAMEGSIEYEPRANGSAFRFNAWFATDAEFQRLTDLMAETRGRRVMLVDGHRIRRNSFAEQVRKWGIRVRVFADVRSAVQQIALGASPDLLLVQQDCGELEALLQARLARTVILVPIGVPVHADLAREYPDAEWMSAPMRRRGFAEVLLGQAVAGGDQPEGILPDHAARRGRVLVIEDSEANRMVLGAHLEKLGCTVDAVDRGTEALRLVSQRNYDLILTDLLLPDMHGLEVAREIRSLDRRTRPAPIVAISGGSHPDDRQRCLAVGIQAFLAKPVSQRDLRDLLAAFLPVRQDSSTAPAFDPTMLEGLSRDLGRERAIDLARAFAKELNDRLDLVAASTDPGNVGREAHALKSTALAFGAPALGQIALELEQACREGRIKAVANATLRLDGEGRRVHRELSSWLEQLEARSA